MPTTRTCKCEMSTLGNMKRKLKVCFRGNEIKINFLFKKKSCNDFPWKLSTEMYYFLWTFFFLSSPISLKDDYMKMAI